MSDIVWFWKTNKSNWFLKKCPKKDEFDALITFQYKSLWESLRSQPLSSQDDNSCKTSAEIFSEILVLDQFSRHILRNNLDKKEFLIKESTQKALSKTLCMINHDLDLQIEISVRAFVYMPLKHIDILKYFPTIQERISKCDNNNNNDEKQLMRFYKDCIRKYELAHNAQICTTPDVSPLDYTFADYRSVCECNGNVVDDIPDHTTCDLYFDNCKDDDNKFDHKKHVVCKHMKEFMKEYLKQGKSKKVCISLSGGPDSMVILTILYLLSVEMDFELCAFHVNYNNRDVSEIEYDFVKYYCRVLGVVLYTKHITSIQRHNKFDRTWYEKTTREIRFDAYRRFGCPIILGHIHDDVVENIWTNFGRGRDLFDLEKMHPISELHGVTVMRPLLKTLKSDIYDFAYHYCIPFLKNTTPCWSNRGKMRNEFIPTARKQFGESVDANIMWMARSLSDYGTILDDLVLKPAFDTIVQNKYGISMDISKLVKYPVEHLWLTIFAKIFHQFGCGMPKRNSTKQFLKDLNNRCTYINIKKEFYLYIEYNGNIDNAIILYVLDKRKLLEHSTHMHLFQFSKKDYKWIKKLHI